MKSKKTLYRGSPTPAFADVTADNEPLPLRLDLANHSPTGFSWGYWGSGPAQLALALLAYHLEDDDRALALYQRFKERVIGRLAQDAPWTLSGEEIEAAVNDLEEEMKGVGNA